MNGRSAGTRSVPSDRRRRTARQFQVVPDDQDQPTTPTQQGGEGEVRQLPTRRRRGSGTTPNDAA